MEGAEMPEVNWADIKFFAPREFTCHCGCGRVDMDENFMVQLDALRHEFGQPLIVSSGYRCPAHNKKVGGGPAHPLGKAADLALRGHRAYGLLGLAHKHGFTGIGVAQKGGSRFIHLDILVDDEGGAPRPWVWSY